MFFFFITLLTCILFAQTLDPTRCFDGRFSHFYSSPTVRDWSALFCSLTVFASSFIASPTLPNDQNASAKLLLTAFTEGKALTRFLPYLTLSIKYLTFPDLRYAYIISQDRKYSAPLNGWLPPLKRKHFPCLDDWLHPLKKLSPHLCSLHTPWKENTHPIQIVGPWNGARGSLWPKHFWARFPSLYGHILYSLIWAYKRKKWIRGVNQKKKRQRRVYMRKER